MHNATLYGEEIMAGWIDVTVFAFMLASSSIIGCYFGCKSSDTSDQNDEYLRGGRSMHIIPIALSLVASYISGITMLGLPSEIYRYGSQYWTKIIAVQLVCWTIAHVHVPLYIELQLTSCYQYLEMRFDKRVRKVASLLFVLSIISYVPIVIYVPALALSQATGINVHVITPVTSLICIFYTTLGGLRAVVWTDTLQVILMIFAMIAIILLGAGQVGGWTEVWNRSDQGNRLIFFNLNPDPTERITFWSPLVGFYFQCLAECGVGQGFVQRYLSVPTLKHAQRSVLLFGIGLGFIPIFCITIGLFMYATYQDCDPLSAGRIREPDQLLPLYVLDVAGPIPGLSGLFFAGVFSAALSSMSTGVNALSGVLVEDLLESVLPKKISKGMWLRIFSVLTGVVCVVLVMLVEKLGGVIQSAYSLSGITAGTMLGLFCLGMFFPRTNVKGALAGSLSGLVLMAIWVLMAQTAIARGDLWSDHLPVSVEGCPFNSTLTSVAKQSSTEETTVFPLLRISFMYYSLIGTILVLAIGLSVSSVTGPNLPCRRELIVPFIRRYVFSTDELPRQQHEIKPLVNMETINN